MSGSRLSVVMNAAQPVVRAAAICKASGVFEAVVGSQPRGKHQLATIHIDHSQTITSRKNIFIVQCQLRIGGTVRFH